MANFAYFPDYLTKFVAAVAVIFNLLTTVFICDLLDMGHGENYFAFCGPDIAYTKTLTNIIIYILPSLYFVYKLWKTRIKKSKWKSF